MMKRVLSCVLLLGWLTGAPQVVSAAEASVAATASNSVPNSVSSGAIKLTAVFLSTSPNSGLPLNITSFTSNRAYFYLTNFGTVNLLGFDVAQSNSTSTLRYCAGQEFRANSSTKCLDNSNAISVGQGLSLPGNVFSTALAPNTSYVFCSTRTNMAANVVSVSVSPSNVTPSVVQS